MSEIYDLLREVDNPALSKEYQEKMVHRVPSVEVVERERYLLKAAHNKVVLDIGCLGEMGKALQQVTKEYHGIDLIADPPCSNYYQLNLDYTDALPAIEDLELIIAGEVIEHISNAGHFLDLLHGAAVPAIITTPNAFGSAGATHIRRGIELVNKDHVSWYSYKTLKTLITRHHFRIEEWFWYRGKPMTAEGLIFSIRPRRYGKAKKEPAR